MDTTDIIWPKPPCMTPHHTIQHFVLQVSKVKARNVYGKSSPIHSKQLLNNAKQLKKYSVISHVFGLHGKIFIDIQPSTFCSLGVGCS